MRRILTSCGLAAAAVLSTPQFACADEGALAFDASPVRIVISLMGLAVALLLLVEVIMLRKVALGGAIAARISYVVLAIVCLGASAVAQWTRNFVSGLTLEQMQIASEVFVIVAMALFAAYFAAVRRAFQAFLTSMTGGEMLAAEQNTGDDADAEAKRG